MKVSEIEIYFKNLNTEELIEAIEHYKEDERSSVKKLCIRYLNKVEKSTQEKKQWEEKLLFDEVFHNNESILVGIDEVGRGPLAGPVVAAAVILPRTCDLIGLKDSKKLSEDKRELLYELIVEQAEAIGIGIIEADEIDRINILQATFKAMREAVNNLNCTYDLLCVDGDKEIPNINCTQHAIIKGDDKSAAIAAASVIAKVTRDRLMQSYAQQYPLYDWENNKGYGSQKHYEGIRTHGMTALHRKSFLKNEVCQ